VNGTGTATVSASGTWSWPYSSLGATSSRPCDHRFGVGWGIVWNDSADAGVALTSNGVTLHVGSTGVNAANTDDKVTYSQTDPCGTFTETNSPKPGDGDVSGSWKATHIYASLADVPADICVVTYDLGPGTSPAAFRLKLTYTDNSFDNAFTTGGAWNSTPGGPNCIATDTLVTTGVAKTTPTLSTQATGAPTGSPITDTANLSATSGKASGTITFSAYGPTDTTCTPPSVFSDEVPVTANASVGPVSFIPTDGAGSYRWIASYGGDSSNNPVSGHCGDAGEISVVTAVATTPAVAAPKPQAPIPGVTTVHTGEPWAGDGRIVVGIFVLGVSLLCLGQFRRRRRLVQSSE
jgi:hypothetical protein